MIETNPAELLKAIEVFKSRQGNKVVYTDEDIQQIIQELRTEAKKTKTSRRKK